MFAESHEEPVTRISSSSSQHLLQVLVTRVFRSTRAMLVIVDIDALATSRWTTDQTIATPKKAPRCSNSCDVRHKFTWHTIIQSRNYLNSCKQRISWILIGQLTDLVCLAAVHLIRRVLKLNSKWIVINSSCNSRKKKNEYETIDLCRLLLSRLWLS